LAGFGFVIIGLQNLLKNRWTINRKRINNDKNTSYS
jgi:hypothetical protein